MPYQKVGETGHILCLCATNQGCMSASVDGILSMYNFFEDKDVPEVQPTLMFKNMCVYI